MSKERNAIAKDAVRGWLAGYLPSIKAGQKADKRFHEARRAILHMDAFKPIVVNDAAGNPSKVSLVYDDGWIRAR